MIVDSRLFYSNTHFEWEKETLHTRKMKHQGLNIADIVKNL